MPEGVLAELARLRVPPEPEAFLADGTASAGRCGGGRARAVSGALKGLGMGEAEAMRIVDE